MVRPSIVGVLRKISKVDFLTTLINTAWLYNFQASAQRVKRQNNSKTMKSLIKNRILLSYSLAHFSVDLCAGALPIIMLYLSKSLTLTIAQSGLVLGVYTMSSSLSQPLFGYISDRLQSRWQSALGLAWLAIFQGATGFASNYGVLLLLAGLAGLGSGAFHPHGASGASRSGGPKKTSAMAIFMMGGNTGYALGPVVAAALLEGLGLHGSGLISVIGLLLVPFVYAAGRTGQTADLGRPTSGSLSPAVVHRPPSTKRLNPNPNLNLNLHLNPNFTKISIVALLAIMFFRAWTQAGITAFTPLYFNTLLGYTGPEAARVAFINLFALALGGLVGGVLADRFGGRRILLVTYLIYAPAVFLLFSLQNAWVFLIAPLAGFVAGASWPPLIVMSQELFPKGAGVGSGIALGFAFAMGGIGQSITGWLAEPGHLGLQPALHMLAALPILAALCVAALPSHSTVTYRPLEVIPVQAKSSS